jgi:hypothetical protein
MIIVLHTYARARASQHLRINTAPTRAREGMVHAGRARAWHCVLCACCFFSFSAFDMPGAAACAFLALRSRF